MKTGWWRRSGLSTAVAALLLTASAPGASAQVDDEDCRCVDADGNAIENCTCFVMPEVPDLSGMPQVFALGPDGDFNWSFTTIRPRLGVSVSTDQDEALDAQGARVTDVMEDGPADEAGIREGDVITSVDGRSLLQALPGDVEEDFDLEESIPVQRLLAIARYLEPGEVVEVEFLRGGEVRTATVEAEDLAGRWREWARGFREELEPRMRELRQQMRPRMEELREEIRERSQEWEWEWDGDAARHGLRLTELTPGLGQYFGTDRGVLVTDVEEDSPLGLRPGDVILRVGDREATSPERVHRVLAGYGDDEDVTFRIRREGSEIDVLGRLGA